MRSTASGADEPSQHIVIAGPMGVGKTTVGRLLASELGMPFLDSDDWLQARVGATGAGIAARDGVARLHELELEVFLGMTDHDEEAVIAPAASVVDHEAGRDALAENLTVWLTAPDDVLEERQRSGSHRREIEVEAHRLLRRKRSPHLEKVVSLKLDTGGLTADETVERLVEMLP